MQCCYLRRERVLLLQRFADGSAEIATGGEIKKLNATAAAQITTSPGAGVDPVTSKQSRKRADRTPLHAMANELVMHPTLIFQIAKELSIPREWAEQVRDEVLAEYNELGETLIRRGSKRPPKPLNERDQRIAALMAEGLPADQIAADVGLSRTGAVAAVRRIAARMSSVMGKGVICESRLNRDAKPPKPEKPLFFKPEPEPPNPELPKLSPKTQALCDRIDEQFAQIWSDQRLAVAA